VKLDMIAYNFVQQRLSNSKINLENIQQFYHQKTQISSVKGQVAGTCECGNKPLGSIKCGEFLDSLKTS
jgi:methionyl-tRNA synthetase